jgi:hypothetical protein
MRLTEASMEPGPYLPGECPTCGRQLPSFKSSCTHCDPGGGLDIPFNVIAGLALFLFGFAIYRHHPEIGRFLMLISGFGDAMPE